MNDELQRTAIDDEVVRNFAVFPIRHLNECFTGIYDDSALRVPKSGCECAVLHPRTECFVVGENDGAALEVNAPLEFVGTVQRQCAGVAFVQLARGLVSGESQRFRAVGKDTAVDREVADAANRHLGNRFLGALNVNVSCEVEGNGIAIKERGERRTSEVHPDIWR